MGTATRRSLRREWTNLPWHALALAAFPAVFLYAENAGQQLTLGPMWLLMAESVIGGTILLVLTWLLLRDIRRAGLLTSLLLAAFFSFGHLWTVVRPVLGDPLLLLAIYVVPVVIGTWFAVRGGRWVRPAGAALNLFVLLLLTFNVYRVVDIAVLSRPAASLTGTIPSLRVGARGTPDIYYLIFDRYASASSMDRFYDFDNTPFLDALRDRGFAVAEDSWANYLKTPLSMVASLSMDYLDGSHYEISSSDVFLPIHRAIRGHLAAPAALTGIGYEYVHVASWWDPTQTNADADFTIDFEEGSTFGATFVASSALVLVSDWLANPEVAEHGPFPTLVRNSNLYALDQLEHLGDRSGPTYLFAHFMLPHPPYVFDADGTWPTAEEMDERSEAQEYVEQVRFTNQQILTIVDGLLARPADELPIVILQADEGPFPPRFAGSERDFQWLEANPAEIEWKHGILNTWYLPGVSADELTEQGFYPRISPVNLFRIVFNTYFDAGLPLLPDRTYLSPDYEHLYDFVEYPRPEPMDRPPG